MTKTILALGLALNFGFQAPALATSLPVVGGKLVKASDSFSKHTVALFFFTLDADGNQGNGLCTGSVLDSSRILTAAHCVENVKAGFVVFALDGVIDIVKGALKNDPASLKVSRKITKIKAEPGYDPNGGDDEFNDVAVVSFADGLAEGYKAAKFLSDKDTLASIQAGGAITLAGYGITKPNSQDGVGTLRKVDRKFLKLTENKLNVWVSGSQGHDACSGDSGGPAFVKQGGEYYVVGVASRSDCVKTAIYTVVSKNSLPKKSGK